MTSAWFLENPCKIGPSTGDIRLCFMESIGTALGSVYTDKTLIKLGLAH